MEDRFLKFVKKTKTCWEWTGGKYRGYGKFNVSKTEKEWAHRLSYKIYKGTIKKNLTIDHVCRNRACVNPKHLEVVTRAENNRRAWKVNRKKTCPKGHLFTKENTGKSKWRRCLTCHRERENKRYHSK